MREKGFAQVLILVLVVVILGVGFFLVKQNKFISTPVPISSPVPAATTDWKTYTNTKYNFLFKYPSDWNILGSDISSILLSSRPSDDSSIKISVDVEDTSGNNTIDGYFENMMKSDGELSVKDAIAKSKVITSLNGSRAIMYDPTVGTDNLERNIISIYQSRRYNLLVTSDNKSKKEAIDIFDQILSTFKFTN